MENQNQEVWIVDDERELAESYSDFLADRYRTRVFNSAEEALSAFDSEAPPPDVIVSDIRMRGIDGLELAKAVKARREDQPVIMVSGYAEKHHFAKASGLNLSGMLEKPCPPDALRALIDKIVGQRKLARIQAEMIRQLTRQAELYEALASYHLDRYAHAENVVFEAGLALHADPADRRKFVEDAAKERRIYGELERIRSRIDELRSAAV